LTPLDCNLDVVPAEGAEAPNLPPPSKVETVTDPSTMGGWGTIDVENQVFRESISIVGTPFQLHYSSERAPGYVAPSSLKIPLSGPSIPAVAKRIVSRVIVAGRTHEEAFPASPNQTRTFVWDGKDASAGSFEDRSL
jgi:hypothetical protein